MKNSIMLGRGHRIYNIPPFLWQRKSEGKRRKLAEHVGFMTPEHQLVHHLVVRELPGLGQPMPPEFIVSSLKMLLEKVNAILDDLEAHKTFLFRNPGGEVVWAYPVTVEPTPHRLTFSTGNTAEEIYAA